MTTSSMGRGITLSKDMYKRMGEKSKAHARQNAGNKYGRVLPYTSSRTDPRAHVRLS